MSRSRSPADSIDILLLEDNSGDVRLVEEALEAMDREVTLHTVTDGYEAIHFLKEESSTDPPCRPDLALLDLDVPGKDGCGVLEAIRADPQLRHLPVIMLTSSDASADIARCYDAYANAYVTKPTDLDGFVSLMEEIGNFWLDRVQFPPTPP